MARGRGRKEEERALRHEGEEDKKRRVVDRHTLVIDLRAKDQVEVPKARTRSSETLGEARGESIEPPQLKLFEEGMSIHKADQRVVGDAVAPLKCQLLEQGTLVGYLVLS